MAFIKNKIMTETLLMKIKELIKRKAKNARNCAAYGGRMGDGGARSMESNIEKYLQGYNKIIPQEWEKYIEEIEKKKTQIMKNI